MLWTIKACVKVSHVSHSSSEGVRDLQGIGAATGVTAGGTAGGATSGGAAGGAASAAARSIGQVLCCQDNQGLWLQSLW